MLSVGGRGSWGCGGEGLGGALGPTGVSVQLMASVVSSRRASLQALAGTA